MTTNKLNGVGICITGATKVKRSDLKQIILKNGGSFLSAVNKKCKYLIIADPNSDTVKANTAREMGVELISEEQFFDMIQ